jgi:MFS family permease
MAETALAAPGVAQPPASAPAETPPKQKAAIFGIVNLSHTLNHANSGMMAVLYQPMSRELGFGPFEIGLLQTTYQIAAQAFQIMYGLLAQYFRRSVLLGVGNIMLGAFAALAAFAGAYWQILALRVASAAGSSPQHPVGSAILISYFTRAKGQMLAMHNAAGTVGSMIAPLFAAAMLMYVGWREIFLIVSIPSILMGLTYFAFRDVVHASGGDKRSRAMATFQQYREVLKNRNIMLVSLIHMSGAAGRGTGIDVAFLVPFFMFALSLGDDQLFVAASLLTVMQFAGLVGPIGVAYLFDRYNQKAVLLISLALSSVATAWLLFQDQVGPALILNVLLYGSMTYARGTLTQAVVAESAPPEQIDVAFSLYYFIGFISGPIWTLITGMLIAHFVNTEWGYTPAFVLVAATYLIAMPLVLMMKSTKRDASPVAA